MNYICRATLAALILVPTVVRGAPLPAQGPIKLALAAPGGADRADPAARSKVAVRELVIEGVPDADRAVFGSLAARAEGQSFDRAELAALTAQIASLARERGFVFATAMIPRQNIVEGKLRVTVDMGRIDDIRLTGTQSPAVTRILGSLAGKPGTMADIERKLLLAQDIPGISLGKPAFLREGDRNILAVPVRQDRFSVSGSLDNYGTKDFGPARGRLGVQANSLLVSGDSVAFGVRTNPLAPDEILQGFGSLSVPVGTNGTQAGVAGSIGDSAPGQFGAGNLKGRSYYAALFASHPLIRSAKTSLWLNSEAAYLALDRNFLGFAISKDTEVTLTVGLGLKKSVGKGMLRATVDVTQGIRALGSTRQGNPLASLYDGDAVFTKGAVAVSYDVPLTASISLLTSASGQIASRPLLAAQELSVGGAYSVRGYDFAETSGDDGATGLLEIRKDWNKPVKGIDRVQAYGFVDAARVADLRSDYAKTLASAGPGVRARIGRFETEVELAFPLTDARLASRDHSPRLNVSLSFGF